MSGDAPRHAADPDERPHDLTFADDEFADDEFADEFDDRPPPGPPPPRGSTGIAPHQVVGGVLGAVAGFLLFAGAGGFLPGFGPIGWAALLAGGLIAATNAYVYLLLPLTVRKQLDLDLTAPPEPLDPAGPYDDADRAFLNAAGRSLAPHGFRRVARLRVRQPRGFPPDLVPFHRPADADRPAESVVALLVPPQNGAPAGRSLSYGREFADGTTVSVTTNYEHAGPAAPGVRTLVVERFADPADAADFLAAGRAAVAAWATAEPVVWDGAADDWAGRLYRGPSGGRRPATWRPGFAPPRRTSPRRVRTAAAAGGPAPPVPPGVYPMTRRGAYRAVWRVLFPVKQIGRRRARARAGRLLSDWGLTPTGRG